MTQYPESYLLRLSKEQMKKLKAAAKKEKKSVGQLLRDLIEKL